MSNRLSYTSVERFLECPQKFYLHDIKKIREQQVSTSLLMGKAIDSALNDLLLNPDSSDYLTTFDHYIESQEINGTKENLRTSKNVKYLKSDLDLTLINHLDIDSLENPSWNSLAKKGHLLLEAYKEQVLPRIKSVVAVQEELSLENEDGDKFVGFADMIVEWEDGRIILFDNKTTSRSYKQSDVRESRQLATYATQLQTKYNIDAIGFITLDKNIRKREPRARIQILIDSLDESVVQLVMKSYDSVNYLVKQGNYPKNEKSCVGKYGRCSFYNLCHNGSMEGLVCVSKDKK